MEKVKQFWIHILRKHGCKNLLVYPLLAKVTTWCPLCTWPTWLAWLRKFMSLNQSVSTSLVSIIPRNQLRRIWLLPSVMALALVLSSRLTSHPTLQRFTPTRPHSNWISTGVSSSFWTLRLNHLDCSSVKSLQKVRKQLKQVMPISNGTAD